ncbi:MAG: pitrilysin family protein [Candidatus Zixiibacteriota bacterium]
MLKKLSLAFLVLCFVLTWATAVVPQELPKINFEKYTLKNGLQVILHEDHTIPMVAVNVWYHVGSKNEKEGRTGFAHLFEHMMFQGSQHLPDKFDVLLDRIGGTNNGSTAEDRTNYWENVPSNYLEEALWVESDRMGFLLPAMTQEKLDNQRDVVKNERRQNYENQPYGKVWALLPDLLFPQGHPYSWPVIGSHEDLTRASKEDIEEFFRSYYTPSNASLCVAGDFDPQTAKALVEKYFGDLPPGPAVDRMEKWIPKLDGEKRMTVEDRVSLPRLYLVWHTPPYYAPGDAELDLLGNILTDGKTSRLYKSLVYDKQIAQDVSAFQLSRELGSCFLVMVTAKAGHSLDELEKTVDQEMELLKQKGVAPQELQRAQNNYEATFVRQLQRIGGFGGKADKLNEYNVYLGDPDRFQWDLNRYLQATPEGVRKVAQEYLGPNRAIVYVVPREDLKAESTQVVRTSEPQPTVERPFAPPQIQKAKLSNGMQVLVVENHKLPLVAVSLVIKSGLSADPKNLSGTASLTSQLLDDGTTTRSALQISDEVKKIGANLGTGSSSDASTVTLNVLKKYLDTGLNLVSDVVIHPIFPKEELERQRQICLGQIMQENMEPFVSCLKLYYKTLYGPDHPYSQPYTGSGTEVSIKALQRDDLKKYYETYYHPNNAAIVVVGDVTLKEILPKLETAFKEWKPKDVPAVAVTPVNPITKTKIFLIDKPGAAQSVVIAGNLGIERRSPDYYAVQVMNNALGGMFSSRINLNLREEKGYTYGAESFFSAPKFAGPFVAYAPVQTQYTKETVAEIEKELRGICGPKPLSAEELQKSKDYLVKSYVQRFQTFDQIAGQVAGIMIYDLPEDNLQRYVSSISGIDGKTAADAAQKYIHPDALLYVIEGDVAKIEPGLRELNIGEIGYLDAEGNPISR